MKYLSVCSGIEAASAAWDGWRAVAFSEIEPFPSAVLAHHYPGVPNWGDMTKFQEWPDADVDVLVGGTPCQSFSVAGLRKGLDDPRGDLMLTYLAIAHRYQPEFIVWENVPGVLSSNGGRDFGTFLAGLEQCGYGWAYRVLDAQYFGVPQRRRRVFVIGCIGNWQRAAAVLFERTSLRGDSTPSRETGKRIADNAAPRLGSGNDQFPCLMANYGDKWGLGDQEAFNGDHHLISFAQNQLGEVRGSETVNTLNTNSNASGRNTPMIAFADVADTSPTLRAMGHDGSHANAGGQVAVAFGWQNSSQQGASASASVTPTLDKSKVPGIGTGMQVRRLTPRECERLQGFPDDYTAIPYRGKPASDGPRYKALGNSMAVPCMRWLGQRIEQVAAI